MSRGDSQVAVRIYLSWVATIKGGAVVAYRGDTNELVFPLIDYCMYLLDDEQLGMSTVKNELLYVKRLLEYIWSRGKVLDELTDMLLEEFRDDEEMRVGASANCSRSMAAHKRTVNAKLRRIYRFLSWLQDVDKSQTGLIAATGARVTSNFSIVDRAQQRPERHRSSARADFPKTILELVRDLGIDRRTVQLTPTWTIWGPIFRRHRHHH